MNYNLYNKQELVEELQELNKKIIELGSTLWYEKGDDRPARDVVKGNKVITTSNKWSKDNIIEDIEMALRMIARLEKESIEVETIEVETIEELDAEPMFDTMPKFEDTILGNEIKEEMVNNAYSLVSSYHGMCADQYSDFLDNLTSKIIDICNYNKWDRQTYIKIVTQILHM